MINQEQSNNGTGLYGTSKKHNIPIEHFDFKYVEKCNDVKELEKIYKVLVSGSEGKFIDLENYVAEKLRKLAPNSRVLRKDTPIVSKSAISKEEQMILEQEINNFLNQMPDLEDKIKASCDKDTHNDYDYLDCEVPPVRNPVVLNIKNNEQKSQITKTDIKKEINTNNKTTKSPKPKDYKEWEKIEKELEKELDNKEDNKEPKKENIKVSNDKTQINTNNLTKKLIKNLPKEVKTEDLTDEQKEVKAESEKCKGNEAFNAGCYDEALVYYTRSLQYLPNAASYNNRAMAYLKLEKWDKCIEDCNCVLKFENNNVKARLRRATAFLKKKKFSESRHDLDLVLKLEPTNKKGNELLKELETKMKLDEEEKAKLNGANRLLIEETDGSSDEEVQEIKTNPTPKSTTQTSINNTSSKPIETKTTTIDNHNQKTSIKIAEVESDDETDTEDENDSTKASKSNESNPTQKVNEKPVETIKLELPEKVVKLKDEAFKLFSNGQYGNACDVYSNSIDNLKQLIEKTTNEKLLVYYRSSLSTLLNNKAACLQKIGDYKACINDCNSGIDLLNLIIRNDVNLNEEYKSQRIKFIFKKAHSLELLEKYKDALTEYESLMRLDSTYQNVQLNYNRIRKLLIDTGELKLTQETKLKQSETTIVSTKSTDEQMNGLKEEKEDKTKLYDEFKQKGNDFVKLNDYESALNCYNKCIEIDAKNTVAYLNRSLCFIKLNKPDEAISDCSFVLNRDSKNVKALFRRSNANKFKKLYNLVEDDLKVLLSIEPNNQIAINEYESIRKHLSVTNQPEKKIEIIEADKKNKVNTQTTNKSAAQKITNNKEVKHQIVDEPKFRTKTAQDFSKVTNAYEFLQSWNSINPKDKDGYTALISAVDASNLPKFIGSKLDDEMLSKMIESIYMLSTRSEMNLKLFDYLKQLSNTQRFNVTKLFISNAQKDMLQKIIKDFNSTNADVIKKLYDL